MQTLRIIGRGTVPVTIRCPESKNCWFEFSETVSNLTIKNLKIITGWGSYTSILGDSEVLNLLVIDNCLFQGHILETSVLHQYKINIMIRNSSFQDCYISFRSVKAVLEGIDAYNSQFVFGQNSTILGKDSKFIGSPNSAIEVASSNITLLGKLTFSNNSAIYGGAIFLYFSNLIISPNAFLVFYHNSALNSGGAISLYSSHLYIGTSVNLTFVNNSAYNKGGAIYIEPGIKPLLFNDINSKLDSMLDDIHVDCFFEVMNCNRDSNRKKLRFLTI